jgi:transcription antitermination protein NusB
MLSRRHIRIKIMQLLYAKSRDNQLTINDLNRRYDQYGEQAIQLYLFNLMHVVEICRDSLRDQSVRRAKFTPTDDDIKFTPKLYDNPVLQDFIKSGAYDRVLRKYQMTGRTEGDTIAALYRKFLETDIYRDYLATDDLKDNDHRTIIYELYKFLLRSEFFHEVMEDFSASWIDDDTLVIGAMKKTLKALPNDNELISEITGEDRLTFSFGSELLIKTYQRDAELLEHIKPMLKNWEAERVATVDMILLKMATAELLGFPTIPTKVTINEYVDISKMYSTDKSKEFVNGILDRLMKKLKEEGLVQKEGRGLIE